MKETDQAYLTEHADRLGDPFAVPAARNAAGIDLREAVEEITSRPASSAEPGPRPNFAPRARHSPRRDAVCI